MKNLRNVLMASAAALAIAAPAHGQTPHDSGIQVSQAALQLAQAEQREPGRLRREMRDDRRDGGERSERDRRRGRDDGSEQAEGGNEEAEEAETESQAEHPPAEVIPEGQVRGGAGVETQTGAEAEVPPEAGSGAQGEAGTEAEAETQTDAEPPAPAAGEAPTPPASDTPPAATETQAAPQQDTAQERERSRGEDGLRGRMRGAQEPAPAPNSGAAETPQAGEASPGHAGDERRRGERGDRMRERRGEAQEQLDAIEIEREELQAEVEELRQQREAELEALADEVRQEGAEVVERTGDRVIIRSDNNITIQNNDTRRFVREAEDVETRRTREGRTETRVRRPGGVTILTERDRRGNIVQRTRVMPDGTEIVLIDNRRDRPRRGRDRDHGGFRIDYYSQVLPPLAIAIPREQYIVETRRASRDDIRRALSAPPVEQVQEAYYLEDVLYNERVRDIMPRIDLDTITFEFNSAAVPDDQIDTLEEIGYALEEILAEDPREVFLIEGHTDAPGTETYNLALSDRRAENVAMILTEYFEVPPENLVTQGYGEAYLKIDTQAEERQNRRVTVRRITPLIAQAR